MSHRRDIIEKADKPLARHFNGRGHSIKDMLFIGIEIVHSKDPYVLGAREGYYINRFDTIDKGLNSNRTKA